METDLRELSLSLSLSLSLFFSLSICLSKRIRSPTAIASPDPAIVFVVLPWALCRSWNRCRTHSWWGNQVLRLRRIDSCHFAMFKSRQEAPSPCLRPLWDSNDSDIKFDTLTLHPTPFMVTSNSLINFNINPRDDVHVVESCELTTVPWDCPSYL